MSWKGSEGKENVREVELEVNGVRVLRVRMLRQNFRTVQLSKLEIGL